MPMVSFRIRYKKYHSLRDFDLWNENAWNKKYSISVEIKMLPVMPFIVTFECLHNFVILTDNRSN